VGLPDQLLACREIHAVLSQWNADHGRACTAQHLDDAVVGGLFDQNGGAGRNERAGSEVDDLQSPLAEQDLVRVNAMLCCKLLPQRSKAAEIPILENLLTVSVECRRRTLPSARVGNASDAGTPLVMQS